MDRLIMIGGERLVADRLGSVVYKFGTGLAVQNGGFESYQLTPWASYGSAQISISNVSRTGGQSMRLTTTVSDYGAYQDVKGLVAGMGYQFQTWVRAESGTNLAVLAVCEPAGGGFVWTGVRTVTTDWQLLTVYFTATSNGTARIILAKYDTTGALLWDDVELVNGATATSGLKMRYYPYGQEVGTATPNDVAKFGTYTRDSGSGLDYAMNRYYQSTWGRFTTADPYRASASTGNPASWNRYSYVLGDPVNANDRWGLQASWCTAEYSYEECGGDNLFWDGPLGGGGVGGGFGGGYADALSQGYVPGMPSAMWEGIQQYNQMVQNAVAANLANAAISAGDIATAISIVNNNPALQFVWIPNIGTQPGQAYQQVVDAYLQGLGIWDLIDQTTLQWTGTGYKFQFIHPKDATDFLANNPLFASGALGAFHAADVGGGAWDYRSWTGSGLPFSLQVTVGDGGAWADVDRYNPYTGLGFIQHTIWEVLPWWKEPIP